MPGRNAGGTALQRNRDLWNSCAASENCVHRMCLSATLCAAIGCMSKSASGPAQGGGCTPLCQETCTPITLQTHGGTPAASAGMDIRSPPRYGGRDDRLVPAPVGWGALGTPFIAGVASRTDLGCAWLGSDGRRA